MCQVHVGKWKREPTTSQRSHVTPVGLDATHQICHVLHPRPHCRLLFVGLSFSPSLSWERLLSLKYRSSTGRVYKSTTVRGLLSEMDEGGLMGWGHVTYNLYWSLATCRAEKGLWHNFVYSNTRRTRSTHSSPMFTFTHAVVYVYHCEYGRMACVLCHPPPHTHPLINDRCNLLLGLPSPFIPLYGCFIVHVHWCTLLLCLYLYELTTHLLSTTTALNQY